MALEYKEIGGDNESNNQEENNNYSIEDVSGENKPKTPKRSINVITVIQKYLKTNYDIRFNLLTLTLEFKKTRDEFFKTLDDRALNTIWINLQLDGVKCSDKILDKIMRSEYTKSYHPLKNYFENLAPYDGNDYIGILAKTIEITDLVADDLQLKELWRTYLEKWLVASVANCLGKGTNHTCLILVGRQGSGKTTWLNKLCPSGMEDFAVCGHINPSMTDNRTINLLAEKWLVNIDDQLENIFFKDFNSLKAIITAPNVTNRKAFARLTKTRARVCSFMGSVNNPQFLTDTSNRRYLVFSTEQINFKHTIDMHKVWAQALHLLNQGYAYWFSDREIVQLNKMNEHFQTATIEQEWLAKIYEPCEPTSKNAMFLMSSEILSTLCAFSGLKLNHKKLSQAFEKLGYGSPISKRIDGRSPRKVYSVCRVSDEQENKFQRDSRKESHKDSLKNKEEPKTFDKDKDSNTNDDPNLFTDQN